VEKPIRGYFLADGFLRTAGFFAAAVIAAPGLALAAAGQAEPWQMTLQDPVTPVAEYINTFIFWLHWGMFGI
jgi:hypothetical protein